MSKKRALWNQKRRGLAITRIMARDGSNCSICGRPLDRKEPTFSNGNNPNAISFDHIIPRADGGTDLLDNLRLAHDGCNSERSDDPVEDPEFV